MTERMTVPQLRALCDSLQARIRPGHPGVVALRQRLYAARHELMAREMGL